MPYGFHNKQKPLKRRFLPILRAVAFFAVGLTVILWDKVLPGYGYKKTLFGALIIVYSVVRLALLLRKNDDDEE